MDFSFTDEQEMLKESIADFMEREVKPDRVARSYQREDGYDAGLFRTAAQSGWLGMQIPEEFGGAGGSTMDTAVAFEGFGSGPLPAPVFSAGVLSPLLVLHGGSADQKRQLLPAMCKGELVATLAVSDSGMGFGPEMVEAELASGGDGFVLNGSKQFVQDGAPARGRQPGAGRARPAGRVGPAAWWPAGDGGRGPVRERPPAASGAAGRSRLRLGHD